MKSPEPNDKFAAAVRQASECAPLLAELADLYAAVDAELAELGVACDRCGRCCDFTRFGHRLYVTPAEAAMLGQAPRPDGAGAPAGASGAASARPAEQDGAAGGRCPYLVGEVCRAREGRALGCRVFFCRAEQAATNALYERFHRRIQDLHAAHRVPYAYADLLSALRA